MNAKEITVLMVEPGKHPRVTILKSDLPSSAREAVEKIGSLVFASA